MPSGAVHRKATALSAPVVFAIGAAVALAGGDFLFFMAGYIVSFVLTPDADVVSVTEGEAIMLNFLPPVSWFVGAVWLAVWTSYAKAMSMFGGHRGLSHVPVAGTATRVAWAILWVYIVRKDIAAIVVSYSVAHPERAVSAFFGLALMDVLHWGMDILN